MTRNQKKIISYLKKIFDLSRKEIIYDYDSNSVIIIDTIASLTIIFHFIYLDNKIILITDKLNKSFS